MMTDEQRRYAHARSDFKGFHVDKAQELLDATDAIFETAERKVKETQQVMEELRPVWAQGWTSDSEAAQAAANALAELWGMLHAINQTEAVVTLETLIESRKAERARAEGNEGALSTLRETVKSMVQRNDVDPAQTVKGLRGLFGVRVDD